MLVSFPQDPDVINTPLPVEYGPLVEEEEKVAARPEDPDVIPPLLVTPEILGKEEKLKPHSPPPIPPVRKVTNKVHAEPNRPADPRPIPEGSHDKPLNLSTELQNTRGSSRNKPTNLWNPTYGSWFTGKAVDQPISPVDKPGLENAANDGSCCVGPGGSFPIGRGGSCPISPGGSCSIGPGGSCPIGQGRLAANRLPDSSVLLEPSTLTSNIQEVPLFRLRHFPCGKVNYGYQQQGLPVETPTVPACANKHRDAIPRRKFNLSQESN